MNRHLLIILSIGIISMSFCTKTKNQRMTDLEVWQLGWRMIASSMDKNYELANLQFDTLRKNTVITDRKYLITGLEVKNKLGKFNEISEIINLQNKEMLQEICVKNFLSNYDKCKEFSIEIVENKELQIELIKMYVNDQYVRSNLMTELMVKYNLTKTEVIIDSFGINTDEQNRERLKEIIEQYGFPTRNLVGSDAMEGIFYIIQHSDGDKEWQKSQLANIERAVKNDDMNVQSYAYLYDRIQINNGEKQLYGTQFTKVDPINKVVEFAETEDLENLDSRRMKIGMMPIQMYKEIMLKKL